MEPAIVSVAQYLDLVNDRLREAAIVGFLVEGEVSDFRIAQGKWVSFDLKDERAGAVLKCFMTAWALPHAIEDGMRVRVNGMPKVYERFGTLKLNVQTIEAVGEGALKRAYEALKKRLSDEGLFDAARKRTLPRFPNRIGLITSRDAAAYGDVMRVLHNRWTAAEVLFTHVHVQGKEAVDEICAAFTMFNQMSEEERPEIVVLVRGGGGLEDLHAFNDERVARAVYGSRIPVVVGVGHERDESLADFVADVRASTPSNAAERVVPSREDIGYELAMTERLLLDRMQEHLARASRPIERVTQAAEHMLMREQTRFTSMAQRCDTGFIQYRARLNTILTAREQVLRSVDPARVLARGYAIVRTSDGRVVKTARTLETGDRFSVHLHEGELQAEVTGSDVSGAQQQLV